MRPWLTIALALASTSTAEPEDEALAAYVRFARTTLPRLEKAWAAPHLAAAAKQTGRGRVLLLTFPNSGTSYTIRAAECLADSQMCSSYLHECEKSRVVKESTSHPFLDRNPELISFQGGRLNVRDPAKLEKAMALYFTGRPAEQLVEFQARLVNLTKAAPVRACGKGAWVLRDDKKPMNDKASPLVKFHGVSYGDDGDLPVSALVKEFRHRFGGGGDFVRVLRLTRNVFDNLVARHHLECKARRPTCPTGVATRENFVRGRGPVDERGPLFLRDVCKYMTWHHRAAAMRRNSTMPWTTLSYETLYEDAPTYFQAVLDVMGLEGDGAAGMEKPVPRCTMDKARLKAREVVRHQGVALPVYLHMFDAATIKRIAMLVGRYLDRSDDFAAPDIKPCMT